MHRSALRSEWAARSLRRPASADVLIAATYGSAVLGLVASPIVARALGPSERGLTAALTAAVGLVVLIGNLGVDSALMNAKVGGVLSQPELNGVARRFSLTWGPVAALGFLAIGGLIAGQQTDRLAPGLIAGAVLVPVGFWGNWCYKSALIDRHIRAQAFHRLCIVGGPAVVGSLLALVGRLSPTSYLLGFVLCNAVGILGLSLAVDRRSLGGQPVRPHLRFGLRASAGSLASSVNQRLDQVLLVPLAGSYQAGLYVVAVSVASLPLLSASAIGSVSVGQMVAEGAVDLRVVARYVRMTILASAIIASALAITAPFLLRALYGQEFQGTLVPLLVLLPGVIAWSAGLSFQDTFTALGRPGTFSSVEAAGTGATVVGLLILAPPLGATGAAAVSSVTYTLMRTVEVSILRRHGLGSILPRAADLWLLLRRQASLVRRVAAGLTRRRRE